MCRKKVGLNCSTCANISACQPNHDVELKPVSVVHKTRTWEALRLETAIAYLYVNFMKFLLYFMRCEPIGSPLAGVVFCILTDQQIDFEY